MGNPPLLHYPKVGHYQALDTISKGLPFTFPEHWEFREIFYFLFNSKDKMIKNNDLIEPMFTWLNQTYSEEPWYGAIVYLWLVHESNENTFKTLAESHALGEYFRKNSLLKGENNRKERREFIDAITGDGLFFPFPDN